MSKQPYACAQPPLRQAGTEKSGFLFTLEAASSLVLLIIASSFILAFHLPQSHAEGFFLCSDAAGVLVKSSAFSGGSLQERVGELESLSSLCIEAGAAGETASSSCVPSGGDKYSFTFPVLAGAASRIENATVSCWQPENP